MKYPSTHLSASLLLCGLIAASPLTVNAGDLPTELTPHLNLRLRFENVDQDNALKDASAATLRHRIGLATEPTDSLELYVESEGVIALTDENFNSGPGGNGETSYSVIADPTDNELNQALIRWNPNKLLGLSVGRQRMIYDNARFIGNVGWRQNEQTYDAAQLSIAPSEAFAIQYAYLSNVNTIFFSNTNVEGHLANLKYGLGAALQLVGYAYLLDFSSKPDSQTLGLRATGTFDMGHGKFKYAAEFAQQSDYGDAPATVDADYMHGELSYSSHGFMGGLGVEILGGDGSYGFSTPLATLHKFNGWADLFLGTPPNGLQDTYLKLAYARSGWKALAIYHRFGADEGSADYGDEIDLLLVRKLNKQAGLSLKFASYSADTHGVDTTKLIAQIDYAI